MTKDGIPNILHGTITILALFIVLFVFSILGRALHALLMYVNAEGATEHGRRPGVQVSASPRADADP